METNYKVFATFNNGETKLHTNFRLLRDRYIIVNNGEPTPIEDYGNWMLFENLVSEAEAFEKYLETIPD